MQKYFASILWDSMLWCFEDCPSPYVICFSVLNVLFPSKLVLQGEWCDGHLVVHLHHYLKALSTFIFYVFLYNRLLPNASRGMVCWTLAKPTPLLVVLFLNCSVYRIISPHAQGPLCCHCLLAALGVDRLILRPVCMVDVGITSLLLINPLL